MIYYLFHAVCSKLNTVCMYVRKCVCMYGTSLCICVFAVSVASERSPVFFFKSILFPFLNQLCIIKGDSMCKW